MACKHKDNSMNNPMANAKGMGAAGEGSEHWMAQRVTAIANIPLMIWFIYSMAGMVGATYTQFTGWLAQPLNAILMILLIISVFYHAKLGAAVIVEDYISCKVFKNIKLIGQKLFFFAAAVACIFCVLKIAFTAGI